MVVRMAIVERLLLIASLLLATTSAIPAVVFPFNSQVPAAARVNQPYSFQFSVSTFVPANANFIYSLTDQPAWLSLDGPSRTLAGTPGQSDAGSSTFTLTAADNTGAAHMQCTLVVATDPLPSLQGDLGDQLAQSTNLSSSNPAVMTLLPGSSFNFHFRQNSFIDIVQRSLYYYATLTDHTPLPSWLHFNADDLTFSGMAPQLSAFPQSFEIMLIASDVPGFAGTSSTFTIRIGQRLLVFVPEMKDVRVKSGDKVEIGVLGDELLLNGGQVDLAKLKSAEATNVPGWMTFDGKTLKLEGTAPDDFQAVNITITVSDQNGDTAIALVRLQDDDDESLFAGTIGTLKATPGEYFDYSVPTSVVAGADTSLMLILPTEARWLTFDASKRELKGDVPTEASSAITATLVARAPNAPQTDSQVFGIAMKATAPTSSTATTLTTSTATPTDSPTAPAAALAEDTGLNDGLPGRTIAGIVIGVVLAVAILLALLLCCFLKRRTREGYEKQASPNKRAISRPIPPPGIYTVAGPTEIQRDVEKADSEYAERVGGDELPPQIALNLPPPSNRSSKWTSRLSRASLASSIGRGEEAIIRDANIPEWGHDSAALQKPHDSFSVPAEMARMSRHPSDISPSKRASQWLRAKRARHQSENAIGLGIGVSGAGLSPSRAESRQKANGLGSEAMLDRSRSRNSRASTLTHNTSLLSVPSVMEFPRPPTNSSFGASKSFIGGNGKRKSVRMVARSDSTATEQLNDERTLDEKLKDLKDPRSMAEQLRDLNDERSIDEKRKSFIRHRASTTLSRSLFSAGLVDHRTNGSGSTMEVDAVPGAVRHQSQLTSRSESSSILPSRSSNRLSQRLRSVFAPNYPRAVSPIGDKRAQEDNNDENWETSSESDSTTDRDADRGLQEEISMPQSAIDRDADRILEEQLTLPRHQRPWVLPNEASPTPSPPTSMARRQPSSYRSSPQSRITKHQQRRTDTSRSVSRSSPLTTQALHGTSPPSSAKAPASRRSRLSEPMALTSTDSLSKVKGKMSSPERPRLSYTKRGRPISVEDVQWLSSLRAERVQDEDVAAGALEDNSRSWVFTDGSSKAFL